MAQLSSSNEGEVINPMAAGSDGDLSGILAPEASAGEQQGLLPDEPGTGVPLVSEVRETTADVEKELGMGLVSTERRSPSMNWRYFHGSLYFFGGTSFCIGSPMFFPAVETLTTLTAAGYLFVFGSLAFIFADATEWWYFRAGCMFDSGNCVDKIDRRAEGSGPGDGLNFFLSIVGSFTYFFGSCFFVPSNADYKFGDEVFALGSVIIVTAQSAKLVRAHKAVGLLVDVSVRHSGRGARELSGEREERSVVIVVARRPTSPRPSSTSSQA